MKIAECVECDLSVGKILFYFIMYTIIDQNVQF